MSSFVGIDTSHPALAGCARLDEVLDDLLGVEASGDVPAADGVALWSLTDTELTDLVRAADSVAARAAGLRARALAECASRDLPARSAATGGTAWLSGVLNARPARAQGVWRTACQLATTAPATQAALCAGAIDDDQAAVIARALSELPPQVPAERRAEGERFLLAQAEQLNALPLSSLASRLLDVIAPEVADAELAAKLDRADQLASRVQLTAADDRHGMVSVRGRFDTESWALIGAALDPLAKPRPAGAARGTTGASAALPDSEVDGTGRDTRSRPQRMGDALVELARSSLDAGTLPTAGGHKPHLALTVDFEALRNSVGAGMLDTGVTLSVAAVRRLACDAALSTVLTDRDGHPLDVGRTQRLFPAPIRCALTIRDRGCAFPGCTRPPSWCDAHHIRHWIDGGETSLANGVLLCRHHHRVTHRGDWSVSLGVDGRPWFTPPDWIDIAREPRVNRSHLRL